MVEARLQTISEAACRAGVHADTLRRWVRDGKIPEPQRNRNDWRVFTEREVQAIVAFAQKLRPGKRSRGKKR
jgi:site-specific DNA-methyltransferase (cytosine-N4-specific)